VTLTAGGTLEIRGTGLTPGSTVEAWIYSTPTLVGRLTTGPDGSIDAVLVLPEVEAGAHTLEVRGVDAAGASFVVRVPTVVEQLVPALPALPALPGLPATGTDPRRGLVPGLWLLGVGVVLGLWSRSRGFGLSPARRHSCDQA
jgi:hypothetical protein